MQATLTCRNGHLKCALSTFELLGSLSLYIIALSERAHDLEIVTLSLLRYLSPLVHACIQWRTLRNPAKVSN